MENMFNTARNFNQPIGNWDVSNVTTMFGMFYFADEFNQPLGDWNVSNVNDMAGMFRASDAANFNQNLSSWDVSGVNLCSDFCLNASEWTLPKPNFTNCSDALGCE